MQKYKDDVDVVNLVNVIDVFDVVVDDVFDELNDGMEV